MKQNSLKPASETVSVKIWQVTIHFNCRVTESIHPRILCLWEALALLGSSLWRTLDVEPSHEVFPLVLTSDIWDTDVNLRMSQFRAAAVVGDFIIQKSPTTGKGNAGLDLIITV